MPRVVTASSPGCLVVGHIFAGKAGKAVTISLERSCVWRNSIIPLRFDVLTDDTGRFQLRLPPTVELRAQDGGETPLYRFTCDGIGSWLFTVPDKETWTLS